MRIAIVGGGAAGLVTAYLLGGRHEVHLYERAPNVGGHVRTLGQNVTSKNLPSGKVSENGPLGFHVETSPTFMSLLAVLGIPTKLVAFGSNLFLADDRNYLLRPDLQHWRSRFVEHRTGGLETGISVIRFLVKTRRMLANPECQELLSRVLPKKSYLRDWFRCLAMLSFSTPLERVDSLPVTIAASILQQGFLHAQWRCIPGGVHSYQAKILSEFNGRVFLNSPVDRVYRNENGVKLSVNGTLTTQYDKLVIATPPGCVLSMLDRPTSVEETCFSKWQRDISFRTTAHFDQSIYQDKGAVCPTAADFFQLDRDDFGYNCCVSCLYSNTLDFSFSYNLDDLIDPAKRLDSHKHQLPAYSSEAIQHREELICANGANHTFYAGAYLGFGLHESAVSSANRIAQILGERSLEC